MDETENLPPISSSKYDLVHWSPYERFLRKRAQSGTLAEFAVPVWAALQVKFRRSILGTYLKFFNQNEEQSQFINDNKWVITETFMQEFNGPQKYKFRYNNNFHDDVLAILKNGVNNSDEINHDFMYQQLTHLRLDDFFVTELDGSLKSFENLQFLSMCGNWLKDFEGRVLPRRLKFLELYANEIESVANVCKNLPKKLTHLGFARNKLTNESQLHLLSRKTVPKLKSLDLADCDIYSLVDVLTELQNLQHLEGLFLQGNPCSMVAQYKTLVLNTLPNLIFLDGLEISRPERNFDPETEINAEHYEFIFNCSKVDKLPQPPKDKKSKQTLHMEIDLPLFQDFHDFGNVVDVVLAESSTDKKTKESKKSSPYTKPNEYDPKLPDLVCKTERKIWSKNMNFPKTSINSPNSNNLFALRDSFRSSVNVKLVYLKILIPKVEKGKKGKKGKDKKDKKDKKGKKDKKQKGKEEKPSEEVKIEEVPKIVEPPKEQVLKRVTVANFTCDLRSVDWRKSCLEFFWSSDPNFGSKAMELEDYLESIKPKPKEEPLAAKTDDKKKGKGKKEKKEKKSAKSKKDKGKKKDNFLTLLVNFSIRRE